MTRKIFAIVMSAMLLIPAFAISAFAAETDEDALNYITAEEADSAVAALEANKNDFIVYSDFNANDTNDGLTPETPKKTYGTAEGKGMTGLLYANGGGTLVGVGMFYIGVNYAFPAFEKTFVVTTNDGTTDFKNPEPAYKPGCALHLKKNCTLTFKSDTIIDDIILFNESDGATSTYAITNNSTMVIGENVITQNAQADKDGRPFLMPVHVSLYVEEGSTLIVRSGTFEKISGEGNVYIADGVTIEDKLVPINVDELGFVDIPVEITLPKQFVTEAPDEVVETSSTTISVVEAPSESSLPATLIGIGAVIIIAGVVVIVIIKNKKKK